MSPASSEARGALLRQLAHLIGDDSEALAVLAGACGLDRGVEREKVGLVRQLANDGMMNSVMRFVVRTS